MYCLLMIKLVLSIIRVCTMKLLTCNAMKDIFQKGMFLWLDLHHTKTVQNCEMQSFDIVNLPKMSNSTPEFRK